jgi:hypothetical protein
MGSQSRTVPSRSFRIHQLIASSLPLVNQPSFLLIIVGAGVTLSATAGHLIQFIDEMKHVISVPSDLAEQSLSSVSE